MLMVYQASSFFPTHEWYEREDGSVIGYMTNEHTSTYSVITIVPSPLDELEITLFCFSGTDSVAETFYGTLTSTANKLNKVLQKFL